MNELFRLRQQAKAFLEEHDELVAVTIRRKIEPPTPRYKNAQSESYKLMPETCPTVRKFIEDIMKDGETVTREMRDAIFQAHQGEISHPWREKFGDVLEQKHRAITELKRMRRQITEVLDLVEGIDYDEIRDKGQDAAVRTVEVSCSHIEEEESL